MAQGPTASMCLWLMPIAWRWSAPSLSCLVGSWTRGRMKTRGDGRGYLLEEVDTECSRIWDSTHRARSRPQAGSSVRGHLAGANSFVACISDIQVRSPPSFLMGRRNHQPLWESVESKKEPRFGSSTGLGCSLAGGTLGKSINPSEPLKSRKHNTCPVGLFSGL